MGSMKLIMKKIPLLTLLGIFIISMNFVLSSCGDSTIKTTTETGSYAVDLSKAPGTVGAVVITDADGHNPLPDFDDKFTVEVWVQRKTDNLNNLNGGIFTRFDGGAAGGISLYVKDNEPKFIVRIPGAVTSTDYIVGSGFTMAEDTWYHLAGVLTNISNTDCATAGTEIPHLEFYVNGSLENCGSTGENYAVTTDTGALRIGYLAGSDANAIDGFDFTQARFDGVIDEIRFWTVARTQQQIQDCMQRELDGGGDCGINSSILKGYWRFNEGPGQDAKILDSSYNAYGGGISSGTPPADFESWDGGWVAGYPF